MKRKPKTYSRGQCLDDITRSLHRLWDQGRITRNDLLACIDAALRIRNIDPHRDLRAKSAVE